MSCSSAVLCKITTSSDCPQGFFGRTLPRNSKRRETEGGFCGNPKKILIFAMNFEDHLKNCGYGFFEVHQRHHPDHHDALRGDRYRGQYSRDSRSEEKGRRPSGRKGGLGGGDHHDPVRVLRRGDVALHRDFGQCLCGSRCAGHFLLCDGDDPGYPAFPGRTARNGFHRAFGFSADRRGRQPDHDPSRCARSIRSRA